MVFRSLSVHGAPSFCGLVAIVNLALLGPRAGGRPEFVRRVTAASTYFYLCQPFLPFLSLSSIAGPACTLDEAPSGLTRSLARSFAAARLPVTPPPCNVLVYTRGRKKDCIIEETVAREREPRSVGAWCGYLTDEEIHRLVTFYRGFFF